MTRHEQDQLIKNEFKTPVTDWMAGRLALPWFSDRPDVPTALWELGHGIEHRLSIRRRTFIVGSGSMRSIRIVDSTVSRRHCTIERSAGGLIVHDLGSKNGTRYRHQQDHSIHVCSGDVFWVGRTPLLVMNEDLRRCVPTFAEILGTDLDSNAETVLEHAINRDGSRSPIHIMLHASNHEDPVLLAQAIHAVSVRRDRPLIQCPSPHPTARAVQMKLIHAASHGTLVIALDAKSRKRDETFLSMLLSPSYNIRLIALAPYDHQCNHLTLLPNCGPILPVYIRPLSLRTDNNLKLLERMLETRGANFKIADFTEANRVALTTSWPSCIRDMRTLADNLIAIARDIYWERRRWRGRGGKAEVLKLKGSTAHDWYIRQGLTHPLFNRY